MTYTNTYRGIVVDANDPQRRGRVRAFVYQVHTNGLNRDPLASDLDGADFHTTDVFPTYMPKVGTQIAKDAVAPATPPPAAPAGDSGAQHSGPPPRFEWLPWAEWSPTAMSTGSGYLRRLEVGDTVCIRFQDGNPAYPLIEGAWLTNFGHTSPWRYDQLLDSHLSGARDILADRGMGSLMLDATPGRPRMQLTEGRASFTMYGAADSMRMEAHHGRMDMEFGAFGLHALGYAALTAGTLELAVLGGDTPKKAAALAARADGWKGDFAFRAAYQPGNPSASPAVPALRRPGGMVWEPGPNPSSVPATAAADIPAGVTGAFGRLPLSADMAELRGALSTHVGMGYDSESALFTQIAGHEIRIGHGVSRILDDRGLWVNAMDVYTTIRAEELAAGQKAPAIDQLTGDALVQRLFAHARWSELAQGLRDARAVFGVSQEVSGYNIQRISNADVLAYYVELVERVMRMHGAAEKTAAAVPGQPAPKMPSIEAVKAKLHKDAIEAKLDASTAAFKTYEGVIRSEILALFTQADGKIASLESALMFDASFAAAHLKHVQVPFLLRGPGHELTGGHYAKIVPEGVLALGFERRYRTREDIPLWPDPEADPNGTPQGSPGFAGKPAGQTVQTALCFNGSRNILNGRPAYSMVRKIDKRGEMAEFPGTLPADLAGSTKPAYSSLLVPLADQDSPDIDQDDPERSRFLTERVESWASVSWAMFAGVRRVDEVAGTEAGWRPWGEDKDTLADPYATARDDGCIADVPYLEELDRCGLAFAEDTLYLGAGKDIRFVGGAAYQFNHGTFVVKLRLVGGLPGTKTSPPTFSYEIQSLYGGKLADDEGPLKPRGNGKHEPATYGLAYRDAMGFIRLYEAAEPFSPPTC